MVRVYCIPLIPKYVHTFQYLYRFMGCVLLQAFLDIRKRGGVDLLQLKMAVRVTFSMILPNVVIS